MALFVTHSPAVGGAEVVLGRYLAQRPGEHGVLVLSSGPCGEYFAERGAYVQTLTTFDPVRSTTRELGGAAALRGAWSTTAGLRAVAAALRESGEHIAVTNSMKAHAVVPGVARVVGMRCGIRLHDVLDDATTSATARHLMRVSGRLSASTAAVSRAAADAAVAVGMPRVAHFPNGIDVSDAPLPDPAAPPLRLLTISQLARWKGVHDVLEAVAVARESGQAVELDVLGAPLFGDEEYERELHERAGRPDLAGAVRFHGHTDPQPHLAAAHAVVHLPVAADPLPTTLIEALAGGVPAIATATGGIPEIVEHRRTGLLVAAGDPRQAAAAIAELADPALRAELRRESHRRALERFSIDVYARSFDAWIESLSPRKAAAA
jgi:glycosyltransferase involved in cell wall biosynthesis